MNEVAKHFATRYFTVHGINKHNEHYSVIFFLIMWNQYGKIVYGKNYQYLSDYINRINDLKWYKEETKKIMRC